MKKSKTWVILFANLYLLIGLGYLIGGAADSPIYIFDDILVRFIGIVLISSSIGLLLRKEIARKGIIIALSMSIFEAFIGVPKDPNIIELIEFIVGAIILLLLYVPGLVYFLEFKSKEYLN